MCTASNHSEEDEDRLQRITAHKRAHTLPFSREWHTEAGIGTEKTTGVATEQNQCLQRRFLVRQSSPAVALLKEPNSIRFSHAWLYGGAGRPACCNALWPKIMWAVQSALPPGKMWALGMSMLKACEYGVCSRTGPEVHDQGGRSDI